MPSVQVLEKRIAVLEKHIHKNKINKSWKKSLTRLFTMTILKYLVIVLYLQFALHTKHPWLQAIVPLIGILIVTIPLPWIKKIWMSIQKN